MSLKLQQESPSDNDLFEGESHKKVAQHMAEVLRESDNNIIGLEGELGSGKSTIINFLKDELRDDYIFIEFDAERYHHGNTKKALIEVIYKGLSNVTGVNKNKLDEHRNRALGNVIEYEKKIKSQLSWWAVLFVLFSLLSVQTIRYLFIDTNSLIYKDKPVSITLFILESLIFLSPAILLIFLYFYKKIAPKKIKTTIGDLFKRNSTDKISETWMVSREVGAIELHDALAGFTERNTLPHTLRFIFIIDNLDRIISDKVKELWSDMELITGATNERFRIIIPYSARQVSSSLDMEGYSGREFIAKRIPVTFSVPPLITAGWQNAFKTMWTQTVTESDESSCIEVIQLIERWRPLQYPRITPRLLKKLVNDIYTLNLTVPGTPSDEKLRFVLIALYILMVKYGDIDIRTLLRNPFQNEENNPPAPEEQDDKLKANYAQLKRIFINDENRWSEFLMSVHYQAAAELARSELIDTPLVEAVKAKDADALERLVTMWGFAHAWNRCAARMDMTAWLETVAQSQPMLSLAKQQIEHAIQQLNSNYATEHKEDFNPFFNKALLKLINSDSIKIEKFMKNQHNFIVSLLNGLKTAPNDDNEYIKNIFYEADQYSLIFKKSILKKMKNEIPGYIYTHYLLGKENTLKGLEINNIEFNDDEIENIIISALEKPEIDIFNPGIIRFIGVDHPATESVIKLMQESSVSNNKLLNDFINESDIKNVTSFRKLIFTKEWNLSGSLSEFIFQDEIMNNNPVEFSAHVVAHMVARRTFENIEDYSEHINNIEYTTYLFNYLRYSTDWRNIAYSLTIDKVIPFVKEAIKKLFKDDQIYRIDVIDYIKNDYLLLKKNITDIDVMEPVISREEDLIERLTIENLEELDQNTIYDILNNENLSETHKKFYSLSKSLLTPNSLSDSFKSITNNNKVIFNQIKKQSEEIIIHPDVNYFADWYRNTPAKELNENNNIRFIWELLNEVQQQEIITQLHDILLEVQVSLPNRVKLLHDFGDVISFTEPEKETSRRGIAALFDLAEKDSSLRMWLDRQTYAFSNWPRTELRSTTKYIIEHHELFPEICNSSKYIENRIRESKIEQSSEPTVEISDSDD